MQFCVRKKNKIANFINKQTSSKYFKKNITILKHILYCLLVFNLLNVPATQEVKINGQGVNIGNLLQCTCVEYLLYIC